MLSAVARHCQHFVHRCSHYRPTSFFTSNCTRLPHHSQKALSLFESTTQSALFGSLPYPVEKASIFISCIRTSCLVSFICMYIDIHTNSRINHQDYNACMVISVYGFGPMIRVWSMRFEAKHRHFKQICRRTSFKNLLKTLTINNQCLTAYNIHCSDVFSKICTVPGAQCKFR